MGRQRTFYLSGALSFLLYLAIVGAIFSELNQQKFKTMEKNRPLEIDLSFIAPLKEVAKAQFSNTERKPAVQAAKSIKSLFDDLNSTLDDNLFAKKVTIKSRKEKKVELEAVTNVDVSRLFTEERQRVVTEVKHNIEIKPTDSVSVVEQSDGIYNEYIARVHEVLARGWNPRGDDAGKKAVLILDIEKDGTFEYYIKYSTGSSSFNQRLKAHLNKLKESKLPKPDKGFRLLLNFIAKG